MESETTNSAPQNPQPAKVIANLPLAYDLDGDPVLLPPEAFAWRVRRRSGKQGRPQCVYHHTSGTQLHIALDATVEDLRPYGPGVYRLDAVDKAGNLLPNTIAQTEVTEPPEAGDDEDDEEVDDERAPDRKGKRAAKEEGDDGAASDRPYRSPKDAGELIRHLVDANVRVMEAMARAFGRVRPVPEEPMSFVDAASPRSEGEGGGMQHAILDQLLKLAQGAMAAKLSGTGGDKAPGEGGK